MRPGWEEAANMQKHRMELMRQVMNRRFNGPYRSPKADPSRPTGSVLEPGRIGCERRGVGV